jgi:hypothetical protein
MNPGPELDAQVCAAVGIAKNDNPLEGDVYPPVSTDIAAAWLVVEKLDFPFRLERIPECMVEGDSSRHAAEFHVDNWITGDESDTPAEAICRAALQALGVAE